MLNKTMHITRYKIENKIVQDKETLIEWITENVKQHPIRDINNSPEEEITGWSDFHNMFTTTFNDIVFDDIQDLIKLNFRHDVKKVDKKILKVKVNEYIEMKGLEINTIKKQQMKEIEQGMYDKMIEETIATPQYISWIWNIQDNTLWFFSTNKKHNECFIELFNKTFNIVPIPMIPYVLSEIL